MLSREDLLQIKKESIEENSKMKKENFKRYSNSFKTYIENKARVVAEVGGDYIVIETNDFLSMEFFKSQSDGIPYEELSTWEHIMNNTNFKGFLQSIFNKCDIQGYTIRLVKKNWVSNRYDWFTTVNPTADVFVIRWGTEEDTKERIEKRLEMITESSE